MRGRLNRVGALYALGTALGLAGGVSAALQPLALEKAHGYFDGFVREGDELVCDAGTNRLARAGVSWHLDLRQTAAEPVTFTAEGRAEGRDEGSGGDFSLYIDVTYMDGDHLWGQQASFDSDPAAGWQTRQVTVFPSKPIRGLYVYLLQRNRPGRVRFRNPRWEVCAGQNPFDHRLQTRPLTIDKPCFLARDVAANGDFAPVEEALPGVKSTTSVRTAGDAAFYDVTLTETTARDRALTLVYACPIAAGSDWLADLRFREPLAGERMDVSSPDCGCGALSRWPFGAVDQQGRGFALGLDPTAPAFYRVVANAPARCLFIAFDLGLAPEQPTAHLRFCSFGFDGKLGFRGALERYQTLFPEANRVRIARQGVWMPFHAVSKVKGWEDFGFRFKEGAGETAWDDAHGLLTFRYTEPCTWWMPLAGDFKDQTVATAAAEAERLAAAGKNAAATGWKKSAFRNEKGAPVARLLDTPWCKGAVWSVNSAPGVGGDWVAKNGEPGFSARYAGESPKGVDGEYVDSAELYVTDTLDFDRSHFAGMTTPLCFARQSHRLGIYKGLIAYEYVRALAARVWPRRRFMMANATPSAWCWLAPYLDVLGTETDWNRGARWTPMSDGALLYRRAICGGKPYCFLMNTDFDRFPAELTEKFMQRALAYGMFPGFFSPDASTGHYFSRPELYERDRPLFKKYIPLCRLVAEAGWRPVNRLARVDRFSELGAHEDAGEGGSGADLIVAEQFGTEPGKRFVTLYNRSPQPRVVSLERLVPGEATRELVTETTLKWRNNHTLLDLPGETVRVLAF